LMLHSASLGGVDALSLTDRVIESFVSVRVADLLDLCLFFGKRSLDLL
jgi:hypothetical protein